MSEILNLDSGSVFDRVPIQGSDGARIGDGILNSSELIQMVLDVATTPELRESFPDEVGWILQEHAHYENTLPFNSLAELLSALNLEIIIKYTQERSILNLIQFYETDLPNNGKQS